MPGNTGLRRNLQRHIYWRRIDMAEFLEVMRQVHRMCAAYTCIDCPLCSEGMPVECMMKFGKQHTKEEYTQAEQIVMRWAKEHPEPRYPTWREWVETCFPTAEDQICPHIFMSDKEWTQHMNGKRCFEVECSQCLLNPIPADIAKKLGVRPREV